MSFITKRERVFNEYDLIDLPPRNEGKLKAYASCTDARAWSHFCATKSEHLTEIIKRNNDTPYPPKYVPTKVIVDTIMVTKNMEISRLKCRIEEFEQMLAVYDELELDCHQKCEIAKAHAAIKAANRNLDDMCLNLDTSYFTEGGMGSEAFETGKSRGDESDRSRGDEWNFEDKRHMISAETETVSCSRDACVSVNDPRIDEMKDQIVSKDAKLCAMRNTLAVMENDVCEPYGIYAHIYTALEKIYGILSQNSKYKQYLNLMTAGKDTRSIDIKGKILFKLKVLEKFCLALIAPCSREFIFTEGKECKCFRAEVITRVDTPFPQKLDLEKSVSDVKRTQLIADIMENVEMKEILDVEGNSAKPELEQPFEVDEIIDTRYSINEENQKRLKDLQTSYDDLVNCYENLKHERDCLQIRCLKYDELESELENLRAQLREYNSLWNEKEHYRKRSEDLDSLKEQYLVLAEESSGLETKLKAESEINSIKSSAVDDLRQQNVSLEKKITDIYVKFEREKNALQYKLQQAECKCMCQEQQIKSLSTQIVQVLEQQPEKVQASDEAQNSMILNEQESLKDQIKNLQDLEEEFQDKLSIISELKGDVDIWRSSYEKISERNKYLEECVQNQDEERMKLVEENRALQKTVHEKTGAVENLMEMINNKSKEINKLMDQNHNLVNQLDKLKAKYEDRVAMLDSEKKQALSSLQLSRNESKELLQKVKDYDYFVQKQEDLSHTIEDKMQEFELIKRVLKEKIEENEKLKFQLAALQNEDKRSKDLIDIAKKDSLILEQRLSKLDNVYQQFKSLKDAYDKLSQEKMELENELKETVKSNKKESNELLKQHASVQEQMGKLELANQSLLTHNNFLNTSLNNLREENEQLKRKYAELSVLEQELSDLRNSFNDLLQEKQKLEHDITNKSQKMNDLYDNLEKKIKENLYLQENIKTLELHNLEVTNSIQTLENDKLQKIAALDTYRKESSILVQRLQVQESLQNEYDTLKDAHNQMKSEKERLQKILEEQLEGLKNLERENQELNGQTNNLLTLNSELEEALITTRNELILVKSNPEKPLYSDLVLEVKNMKEEKLQAQKKIRDLLDSLDASEHFNSNLNETVCARDDKISIMQNQINELEAEIRRLQGTLAQAIDTGNAIKSTSFQNIDQSMKKLEAHHSKATHNIKMEIAMLQNANTMLKDQLSDTRLQSLETLNARQEAQVLNLQNERKTIVTNIQQLEIHSVGDSALMLENCDVERILTSLDRIRGCFNARCTKNTSLEQTLITVQTASQLMLSKADDAKKYIEKEKREREKILNEKDDAIKEKLNLEKELVNQKKQLEGQIAHYQRIIEKFELETENQKLMTDKLKDSTQNYISKLKEEAHSFQGFYQDAISKVKKLEEKNKTCDTAREANEILIKKLVHDFGIKSKEVEELKEKLSDLLNKPKVNKELQVSLPLHTNNLHANYTQTSNLPKPGIHDEKQTELKLESDESADKLNHAIMIASGVQSRQRDTSNITSELLRNQKPPYSVNEVQILAANVEPSFDFVKNSYQNYKIKRLGPGLLEHHSFPDQSTSTQSTPEELSPTVGETHKTGNTEKQNANQTSSNLINIYKRPSNDMDNSSKIFNNSIHKQDSQSPLQTNDSYRTESNVNIQRYGESSPYTPSKSTDKDVLVIYQDSESVFEGKPYDQEEIWLNERNHKTGSDKPKLPTKSPVKSDDFVNIPVQMVYSETTIKKPHQKQKIQIALPRVGHEGTSLGTTSDFDKKSLDSYTVSNYDVPKRNNLSDTNLVIDVSGKGATSSLPSVSNEVIYGDSQNNSREVPSEEETRSRKPAINQKMHDTSDLNEKSKQDAGKKSHHKLARVGADAFLIRSTGDQDGNPKKTGQANQNNFALEYILDTAKREGNVHHMPEYGVSDELIQDNSDKKPGSSKINHIKEPAQSAEFSTSRTISVQRSVMTMPDVTSDYYTKIIQNLTKTLENVEKEYKKKLDAIKAQYDRNINNIINEHNQGVKNIQSLHEETLLDIMRVHENEVDNLRSMSMEAMRKAEKLERENTSLKAKFRGSLGNSPVPNEMPVRPCSPELKRRKLRMRCDTRVLTKTTVEAFNVKPKRLLGPCTCSLDVNISDTIRNIFEQVGAEQRKLTEAAYLKYIAGKICSGNIEGLDAQELSFLHLKVCRTWKLKLTKEEALQKKIDSLEVELINRQRNAQQHMVELDRKVAEEKQRLEQVREAVCRNNPIKSFCQSEGKELLRKNTASCCCNTDSVEGLVERRSAGDLMLPGSLQQKKTRTDSNRAVLAKLDVEERRERKLYTDEPPTRLRRQHDRPAARVLRK